MFGNLFGGNGKENTNGNGAYRNGNHTLIELRKVVKPFETTAGTFTALKGIDVKVDKGEFVAVIGKSGSGKSTLIQYDHRHRPPLHGRGAHRRLVGAQVQRIKIGEWRGRNIGVIFQLFQLLPTLTVVENIMLPMDFCNMYKPSERRTRALELLRQMDLEDQADKLPAQLSGGQQQRVAIARALANDPPILVADEPTGNLDSKTAETVFQMFESLVANGKTILMVTHDSDLNKRIPRTLLLADGEIARQVINGEVNGNRAHVGPASATSTTARELREVAGPHLEVLNA